MATEHDSNAAPFPSEPKGIAHRCDLNRVPPGTAAGGRAAATLALTAIEVVAERFRVLGEPLRVRLIQELKDGEKSVSQLAKALESTQSNISKHLRIIENAGIAGSRRSKNLVYYFVVDEGVFRLCDAVCASVGERLRRDARLAAELNRTVRRE